MATTRVLVLGSLLLACSSPGRPSLGDDQGADSVGVDAAPAGGGTGGAHAGTGGGGRGGAGGGGGTGALPSAPDAASDGASMTMSMPMSHADAAPAAGDVWAKCGPESFKPGISAADFCAKYQSTCKFNPAGDGKEQYKSLDDCTAKYQMLSDGPRGGKACVAYHLCVAASPDSADTFCPHAPEASAMTGPCKASYL